MHDPIDDADSPLDHELRLIREAIQLVSSGASRRVVVAGIRFGEAGADLAGLDARRAGVTLRRLRSGRGTGFDIAVELESGARPASRSR